LAWIDRTGKRSAPVTKPFRDDQIFASSEVALSRDESRAVFSAQEGTRQDLWLLTLARGGTTRRLTFSPDTSTRGVWSPDGTRFMFTRIVAGSQYTLYQRVVDGGDDQLFLRTDGATNATPTDWSPDGKSVVYSVTGEKTSGDLWIAPTDGLTKPTPYLQTAASEVAGRFSPDGRWMAYVSNETGRNEIYVQSVPPGAKSQISTAGGVSPTWRPDGVELFYVAPDQKLMAVPVTIGVHFESGVPQALAVTLPVSRPNQSGSAHPYAPTRDGQRFLVNVPAEGEVAASPPITVVLNWQTGLSKR
jgi:Tol biopolymer transport system component